MEQKKILYMGIDLTDEQAMVSLFGRGMEEPETIMTGASKERYGIPVAMYLADSGHIFMGKKHCGERRILRVIFLIICISGHWMKQRVNRSFIRDCFVSLSSGSFS